MGKHQLLVNNHEMFNRVNYLYQAAHTVLRENPSNIPLIRTYCWMLKTVARKNVMRLDPSIKRTLCRKCYMLLLPGITARVRVRGKRQSHTVVTCMECSTVKRFVVSDTHSIWTEQPEAWIHPPPTHLTHPPTNPPTRPATHPATKPPTHTTNPATHLTHPATKPPTHTTNPATKPPTHTTNPATNRPTHPATHPPTHPPTPLTHTPTHGTDHTSEAEQRRKKSSGNTEPTDSCSTDDRSDRETNTRKRSQLDYEPPHITRGSSNFSILTSQLMKPLDHPAGKRQKTFHSSPIIESVSEQQAHVVAVSGCAEFPSTSHALQQQQQWSGAHNGETAAESSSSLSSELTDQMTHFLSRFSKGDNLTPTDKCNNCKMREMQIRIPKKGFKTKNSKQGGVACQCSRMTRNAAAAASEHSSSARVNGPSTNTNGPDTNVNGPSSNTNGPDTNVNGPSTNTNGPNGDVNGPSTNTNVPSTAMNVVDANREGVFSVESVEEWD